MKNQLKTTTLVIIILSMLLVPHSENKAILYTNSYCTTCKEVLNKIENDENLEIKDTNDPEINGELTELLLGENIKPTIPVLVVEDKVYHKSKDIIEILSNNEVLESKDEQSQREGKEDVVKVNKSIGLVLLAGLVDGVNPCAISMLLFLLSLLMNTENNKIITMGITYALGIFIIYFTIGLGFYKIIDKILKLVNFRLIVYGVSFFIIMIFLIKEVKDYFVIRKGELENVSNELSKKQKSRIHSLIAKTVESKVGLFGIFVLGVAVGILEFACTGQVYLPTVTYMSELGVNITPILLLYNTMFVLPIILITLMVYKTKDILDASMFIYQHRSKINIINILVYGVIAGFFLMKLLRI